jgi:hypothetical protein
MYPLEEDLSMKAWRYKGSEIQLETMFKTSWQRDISKNHAKHFIFPTQGACSINNTNFMNFGLESQFLMKQKPPPYFVFERRMGF